MAQPGKRRLRLGLVAAVVVAVIGVGAGVAVRAVRRNDSTLAASATKASASSSGYSHFGDDLAVGAASAERAALTASRELEALAHSLSLPRQAPGGAAKPAAEPRPTKPAAVTLASKRATQVPPGVLEGVQPVIPPAPPGWTITATHLLFGGLDRYYLIARPEAPVPPGTTLPTLVALHGHWMTPATMESMTRFPGLVGKAILVYPAGYYESWNAGYCCGVAARAGINDVGFLEAVIHQVLTTQPGASPRRVYLVGYSNGGRLAYRMACQDPGAFAGVAAVEAVPVYPCASTRPVPLLSIASTNDPLITVFDTFAPKHIDGHREITVQDGIAKWRQLDGCSATTTVNAQGKFTLTTWDRCSAGGRVQLAVFQGGSHAWVQGGSGNPSDQQLIWSFFNS